MERTAPHAGEFRTRESGQLEKDGARSRTIRFVASDESVDRYGDIIRASGWDLSNFKRNNVLLFGHQSRSLPIGTADAWIDTDRKTLMADATFYTAEVNQFADDVWRIVDAGGMNAVSVGFLPTADPNVLRDPKNQWVTGFEFVAQDLLELSVVPVPANPNALALARSVASAATIHRLFVDDERAAARVAADHRRRSIILSRLRGG